MEKNKKPGTHYATKSPSRGGARPGAGRPKGSGHKVKLEDLMQHITTYAGMPFEERIAMNYADAISRSDWGSVRDYDKALLNKIVADKQEVEVVESEDQVEAKAEAFKEALAAMTGIKK